ncbi:MULTISPECIES: restriction endonuclease subunit S [unclassified Pantoea]|uniref:restriction endonuclease subunit S n=1 Tax=unclassified Pantoea TaxID=2630326 RepID=UPI0001E0E778|nr:MULTISPECIES: restriction endonuclease subunit S [unclassified Pantoea]EFM20320.1 restriction modification system DNA specificity domain protein [Pantoea sp. aB]QNQ58286.1 restriction endonuclease subunit S [Pantoea sp. MT58]
MSAGKLPEGWVLSKFTDLMDVQGGTQPPKSEFIAEEKEGYIRLLQIRDFGKKPVPTYIPETKKLKTCRKEDLLIGRYGASLGRICTGHEGAYNVALAKVIYPQELERSYIRYYLESEIFQFPLKLLSRSAQNGFNKEDLSRFDFLLAPRDEQKIIAEKLDTLLVQVDSTKARLEQIPQILKRFRQAVLAAAVSGKLTEDYRENQVITSWDNTTLGTLIIDSCNGLAKRSGTDGEDITILRLADFKNAQRIHGNERKITLDSKEINKYSLKKSDILVIRVNGSADLAGRFIEYKQTYEIEGFCDHFIRLRLNSEKISSRFLTFIANEGEGRFYLRNSLSTSAGQNTINQTSIKGLALSLPTLPEQHEIVRRVEQLFAYADTIEKQVNNALTRVNNLTQSILVKAFRGELTAQWRAENSELISGEKSAAALLEKIKSERAASTGKKASRKKF